MNKALANCGHCPVEKKKNRFCNNLKGEGPKNCPTLRYRALAKEMLASMDPAELHFSRMASIQEASGQGCTEEGNPGKPYKPRIVEIVEFCRRMKYRTIGLIFCGGSIAETDVVQEIMETNGLQVVSVICKVGCIPKASLGLKNTDINMRNENGSMCNPLVQAAVVNAAKVDFNVLINLCVGHDSLILKHLDAPATVFCVKDRLLGHNPIQAVYLYDTYYNYLKKPLEGIDAL